MVMVEKRWTAPSVYCVDAMFVQRYKRLKVLMATMTRG